MIPSILLIRPKLLNKCDYLNCSFQSNVVVVVVVWGMVVGLIIDTVSTDILIITIDTNLQNNKMQQCCGQIM